MKIARDEWTRLSALLDEALDIEAEQREQWLEGLPPDAERLKGQLRVLLAQRVHVETADFLKAPDLASALREEIARVQVAAPPLEVDGRVGAYRLLRELGRGGMGSVWLAERVDGRLKRQVALKFPYAGPNQRQLAERLGRERDILSRLEHPNIARLYDADVTPQGQPFLVLEYVDGIAINDYCDQRCLTVRDRLLLFLQVLSAVQYAHSHLVIHRDLKPSNIFVTEDGVVRLLDFGIAKLASEGEAKETALTHFGGRALTPDYASPEQICGLPITTESDVYSLGVVLYELLTGTRPYRLRRDSRASLEDAIAEADVIAPSRAAISSIVAQQRSVSAAKLARSLRGDLDAVIFKALQKQAAQRYASAAAFLQDVRHWLDEEAVEAQGPSTWYEMRKLILRNRVLFGAAAAVFISLVAGAAVALWQARAAIAQTQRLQATKTFLIDVFNTNSSEQADPLQAQQTTARELLDRAAERLVTQKPVSPEVTEEMLSVLGGLYEDLGLDEKSAALHRRRAELLTQLYGPDDARVADAQIAYGKMLYATDGWKQAQTPLRDAERILDRRRDFTSLLRLREWAAMTEYLRGVDRDRAREYANRAITLGRARYPKAPEFMESLRLAALVESETGNTKSVLPLLTEALAVQEAAGGSETSLIRPLVELAETQVKELDYAAAEVNFRRGFAISKRRYGDLHIDTIQSGMRLGKFLRLAGRLAESEQQLTKAYESALKLLPPGESFHIPTVRMELAVTEHAIGRYSTAAELYQQAIATREATRSGDRQHANMLQSYALLLTDMGHMDEALRLYARAVQYYAKSGVPVASSDVPTGMAAALIASGRPQAALDALAPYVAGRDAMSIPRQITVQLQQAAALAALGRGPEAEAILNAQIQRLEDLPQRPQLRLLEAESRIQLGRLLTTQGRAAEAREMLDASLEWRHSDLAAQSPLIAEGEVALGECLLALGQAEQSRALYKQAQAVVAQNPELGDQYRKPLRELGRSLGLITAADRPVTTDMVRLLRSREQRIMGEIEGRAGSSNYRRTNQPPAFQSRRDGIRRDAPSG